jgi:hypothetical protein
LHNIITLFNPKNCGFRVGVNATAIVGVHDILVGGVSPINKSNFSSVVLLGTCVDVFINCFNENVYGL